MRVAVDHCCTDEGCRLIESHFDGWKTLHCFNESFRLIAWCYSAEHPIMKRSYVMYLYEKVLTDGTLIWVCWDAPEEIQSLFPPVHVVVVPSIDS